MDLPEAIRQGAKLRPQSRIDYFEVGADGSIVGSCALGAAVEAIWGSRALFELDRYRLCYSLAPTSDVWDKLTAAYPELLTPMPNGTILAETIIILNDTHSREEVADIVEEMLRQR